MVDFHQLRAWRSDAVQHRVEVSDNEVEEVLRLAVAEVPPGARSETGLTRGAAVQMEIDPAWFHWRRGEAIHGLLRAELALHDAAEDVAARGTRPVWDLSGGERKVAAMWVEWKPVLEPGD